MVPERLEYLEIFPSSPASCQRNDIWYGLDRRIKVDTLVLVDRMWGNWAGALPNDGSKGMVYCGHEPNTGGEGNSGSNSADYEASDNRLLELIQSITGIKRLILRLDPRLMNATDRKPKEAGGFAFDLGKCLERPNLVDVEEIVFELPRDDGHDFIPCEGEMHLVSRLNRSSCRHVSR